MPKDLGSAHVRKKSQLFMLVCGKHLSAATNPVSQSETGTELNPAHTKMEALSGHCVLANCY